MKKFIILSLIVSSAYAGDASHETKFLVLPTDPEVDASSLAGENVKVLPAHDQAYSSSLPDVKVRNKIFKSSGLTLAIENWDDFEKDSLFIKLSKPGPKVIERVMKKHPELKKESLEIAQQLIIQAKE